jgi:hypothetical protein
VKADDMKRKGDVLAYAATDLLSIAPTYPCSTCSIDPTGECVLHRRLKALRLAAADWEKKS